MKAFRFRAVGLVQGVGFRAYTRRNADELGIRGWVRNCPDTTVEGWAQGEEDALKALVKRLQQGPPTSTVMGLRVIWEDEPGDYPDFELIT